MNVDSCGGELRANIAKTQFKPSGTFEGAENSRNPYLKTRRIAKAVANYMKALLFFEVSHLLGGQTVPI